MAKGMVIIDSKACKSCRYCVISCPKGVLEAGDDVNSFGYPYVTAVKPEECIGCAMCANICPDAAIEVWRD